MASATASAHEATIVSSAVWSPAGVGAGRPWPADAEASPART
jgi:hypothetical protein